MIPKVDVGLICGSSTNAISFPRELKDPGVVVKSEGLVFETPYGHSPEFTLFTYAGQTVLTCRMHGWRPGVSRADSSRQIFWVFHEAGVRVVLTEGGVGGVNHLLKPRDVVIPTDYLDFTMRKDVSLGLPYLLTMRQPFCPELSRALYSSVLENFPQAYVFARGVYACTDGRHFESPAEVQMLKQLGADIVGQSVVPEVYLAREIGAHYASVQLVVNHAEGVVKDWEHTELAEIFYHEAVASGRVLLGALRRLPEEFSCSCTELRKPTMLREFAPGQASEE